MTPLRTPLRRFTAPSTAPRRSASRYTPRHAAGTADLRPVAVALGAPLTLASVVSAGAPGWTAYSVRAGDTVSELAAARSTTVAAVAKVNGLHHPSQVRVGQLLRLPATGRHPVTRAHPALRATPVVRTRIVVARILVRPGDTLGTLAVRYKASVRTLSRLNGLRAPYRIYAGHLLIVRPARVVRIVPVAPRRVVTTLRYTVRPGDFLSTIAKRQHTTARALATLNRIHSPYVIRIGQVLVVRRVVRAVPVKRATRSVASRTFAGRTYSESVVRAAEAARARLARTRQPTRDQTRRLITSTARRHGVPAALALAIAKQESGWDQHQVSIAGAIGTMQVMPSTGVWMSDVVGRHLDLFRAEDNITAGVVLLRWLRDHTTNDNDAIAAYYEGLGNVQKHGWFPDTRHYVASVSALQRRYS